MKDLEDLLFSCYEVSIPYRLTKNLLIGGIIWLSSRVSIPHRLTKNNDSGAVMSNRYLRFNPS